MVIIIEIQHFTIKSIKVFCRRTRQIKEGTVGHNDVSALVRLMTFVLCSTNTTALRVVLIDINTLHLSVPIPFVFGLGFISFLV